MAPQSWQCPDRNPKGSGMGVGVLGEYLGQMGHFTYHWKGIETRILQ
jgi:hypothetical protein